jgi:hypothetical protein
MDCRKPQREESPEPDQEGKDIAILGDGRALFLTQHEQAVARGEWATVYNVVYCGESWLVMASSTPICHARIRDVPCVFPL